MTTTPRQSIIVMGVSGSGKSTVGRLLAERLNYKFLEGDDFHPTLNIEKMSKGIPLNDEDRIPWLKVLSDKLMEDSEQGIVMACSALKESYRTLLKESGKDILFVFLEGSYDVIHARVQKRTHFMPDSLLKSQFDTLVPPSDGLTISVTKNVNQIVGKIIESLAT